ncbi:arfaptin-1 isoform X6 [Panthera onca]
MSDCNNDTTTHGASKPGTEEVKSNSEESSMAQESPKNSAAEIPVTSNGEVDDSHEHGFNRDLKRSLPAGLGLSETQITSHGFDSTKEGVIEAGAFQGSPAPPLPSVMSPSRVAASRLAQQGSDLVVPAGGQRTQTKGGPVILADEIKNPAMEKLELVRKWSLNTYKEEFGYNADTQKLLAKNGETLLGAINFFIASVNTLVNKTIEDTLMTVKQYESARIEYDAYRTDLEELNLGPRDANTLPKIEQSQHLFQAHKEKYDKMRNDVSIKLKFLEENKKIHKLKWDAGERENTQRIKHLEQSKHIHVISSYICSCDASVTMQIHTVIGDI